MSKTIYFKDGCYIDIVTGKQYVQKERYDSALRREQKLSTEYKKVRAAFRSLKTICNALGIAKEVKYSCKDPIILYALTDPRLD